jgi:hypothetical protein
MDFSRFYGAARHFAVYALLPRGDGRTDKVPTSPYTLRPVDIHDEAQRMPYAEARAFADVLGHGYGVAFWIPPGTLFIDIDHCRTGDSWEPYAVALCERFPGAYIEASQSGQGLHILSAYSGARPVHGTRNAAYRLEAYTGGRFCALMGTGQGDPTADCTDAVLATLAECFPTHSAASHDAAWTIEPRADWAGPADDEALIALIRRSGGGAVFNHYKMTPRQLWDGEPDALARAFPGSNPGKHHDGSAADFALASHIAFYTGCDCERTARLMRRSGLSRDKYAREDYLRGTVLRACSTTRNVYHSTRLDAPAAITPEPQGAPAESVPTIPPAPGPDGTALAAPPGQAFDKAITLSFADQCTLWAGCVYVREWHRILLVQEGLLLTQQQFDATFGGYEFQMNIDGSKPCRSAWKAYLETPLGSQARVHAAYFDPQMAPGARFTRERIEYVNTYAPIQVRRLQGDASPFTRHVETLLPVGDDAAIFTSYLAFMVQYLGHKARYAPLLQGVEGNGKSLFSWIMEYCLGERYTHRARASQLSGKFNSPFYRKLFIAVEDVRVTEKHGEVWEALKPMITETRCEIEPKGLDSATREVQYNFIFNSNHRDALRKSHNDRRILPLFCAQQTRADLARDGLTAGYFTAFIDWLKRDGLAIVYDYLLTYPIPDAWNPARDALVAPTTSSTGAAISASTGAVEMEVLEAVAQCRPGFAGGWISSMALDKLLDDVRKALVIPRGRRADLLADLGYIPHPALPDGRVSSPLPDATRPRLFVLKGHASLALTKPADVGAAYWKAQQPD